MTVLMKPLPMQPEELEVLTPEGRQSLLEWMESSYFLSPKVHGLSAKWSLEYGPFWKQPIEWLNDAATREVWCKTCSQCGKSTLSTGWIGYTVDVDPVPMGIVMPRKEDAEERVETNVIPMFEENTRLLSHAGGSVNNINIGKMTMFDSMAFYLLYSTTAAALAGKSICRLVFDEVGKFPRKVGGEAGPIDLGRKRLRTFKGRSKLLGLSTPVAKGDAFSAEWSKGDCCEWWIPCQMCGYWQRPQWSGVELDRSGDGSLLEPETYRLGGRSRYRCQGCNQAWSESDRWMSVCAGRWVPGQCTIGRDGRLQGPQPVTTYHSCRITALLLHPAIQTIDDLAAEWATAQQSKRAGDLGPLQDFINSQLAEDWEIKEKVPQEEMLAVHVGQYERGSVPLGVQAITTAIDVQIDHVWILVMGWGYQFEGWVIYAGRIETGSTDKPENLEAIRPYLTTPWVRESDGSGLTMGSTLAGIDSKYRPDSVNAFCRSVTEAAIVPLMGYPENKMTGRMYRIINLANDLKRHDINVDRFKDSVFRQLFITDKPGPGFIHLYKGFENDYMRQLSSEHQVKEQSGKKAHLTWQLIKPNWANHMWDCMVYNRFLAEIIGVQAMMDYETMARMHQQRYGKKSGRTEGFLADLPEVDF